MKSFFKGAGNVLGAFFMHLWKFFFDLFTDKQGNYDEKRVIGFVLIALGVASGLGLLPVKVDLTFAYFLVSTGIGLYFGAGAMDGIGMPQISTQPVTFSTTGFMQPQGAVVNQFTKTGANNGIGER